MDCDRLHMRAVARARAVSSDPGATVRCAREIGGGRVRTNWCEKEAEDVTAPPTPRPAPAPKWVC